MTETGARHWLGFGIMCFGMFMAVLDIQIVASSLPDIQAALGLRSDQVSWIQTAYLVAEVVAIPMTGLLIRALSTRVLFTFAVLGFTLASFCCAISANFSELIAARILQGLTGGLLIPTVFTAVYVMFEPKRQAIASAFAGISAMMAPTLGPILGGYITDHYSWHWLFLINLVPGILVTFFTWQMINIDRGDHRLLKRLDIGGFVLLAAVLTAIMLLLKEAPKRGWLDPIMLALTVFCIVVGYAAVNRCVQRIDPVVDFTVFRHRSFVIGGCFSFILGAALFSATYLMPLFLGYVRQHTAFEIGRIMIVTGAAQLVAGPIASLLVRRLDPRIMTGFGFALFAVGLYLGGLSDRTTDQAAMFWPQLIRGTAIMLCILPITDIALGSLAKEAVANASGLFNMLRNLGGAIGIALVDTVLEGRGPHHAEIIAEALRNGSRATAQMAGLPLERFHDVPLGALAKSTEEMARPYVERAAMVLSFNDAWKVLAALTAVSLVLLPLARRPINRVGASELIRESDAIG